MTLALPSWRHEASRKAIEGFVGGVSVPAEQRIAVFDNDGTLWCEKPIPIQLGFILERMAQAAQRDPQLRDRQPWKAAYTQDHDWLSNVVIKHYRGDETDVKTLIAGIAESFGGMDVEEYAAVAAEFVNTASHPALGMPYAACAYQPMIELLRFLEAYGFTCYIASGGDRDFMRSIAKPIYGLGPERIVGSAFGLEYIEGPQGTSMRYKPELDFFDDGPQKPVRIWSRIGRRPILAVGNANGDIPMLAFTDGLRIVIDHDDSDREFAYTAGAEAVLQRAQGEGWTVVSMRDDWTTVFAHG